MSRLSPSEVAPIADLARLELGEDELSALSKDLDRILEYARALQALDTEGVEPTEHAIPLPTPMRPDRAEPPLDPELALSNAPERDGTAFVVPKVIDDAAES